MAEITWVHRTMVVTDAIAAQARAVADQFGPAASGMWTTPLSPTGALPATHWISAGLIDQQFADMLASPESLQAGSAALGVTLDLAVCQALLTGADVSAEAPFEAMARLGLQMIQEPA